MSKDIESTVNAILEAANITYSAVHRGLKANPFGEKTGYSMDRWSCEFTNASKPNEPEEFDYFTGLGHRAPAKAHTKSRAAMYFQGLTENDKKGLTSYGKRYLAKVEELRKPVTPCAAGVLHSLILDSSACEQSFESWCNDLGYDSDSRKAYATYEACQKNADKLARVIPRSVREQLQEALQDY